MKFSEIVRTVESLIEDSLMFTNYKPVRITPEQAAKLINECGTYIVALDYSLARTKHRYTISVSYDDKTGSMIFDGTGISTNGIVEYYGGNRFNGMEYMYFRFGTHTAYVIVDNLRNRKNIIPSNDDMALLKQVFVSGNVNTMLSHTDECNNSIAIIDLRYFKNLDDAPLLESLVWDKCGYSEAVDNGEIENNSFIMPFLAYDRIKNDYEIGLYDLANDKAITFYWETTDKDIVGDLFRNINSKTKKRIIGKVMM